MPRRLEQAFWSVHSRTSDDAVADEAVASHIAELADWLAAATPTGMTVADLGCGTGDHSLALAERGVRVIGVDLTRGMLVKASAKGSGRLVQADLAADLPLRSASLGGALSVYSAQFLQLRPFVTELRRVLVPGAPVLVEIPRPVDVGRDLGGLPARYRAFQRLKRVAAAVGQRQGTVRRHTLADLHAAMEAAGFPERDERSTAFSHAILAT